MNKIFLGALVVLMVAIAAWFLVLSPNGVGGPMDGKVLTVAEKAQCGITAEVTEGPYYVSGTKKLVNGDLNYSHLSGDKLTVSGHVYEGLDNTKPLKNAKIEIGKRTTLARITQIQMVLFLNIQTQR